MVDDHAPSTPPPPSPWVCALAIVAALGFLAGVVTASAELVVASAALALEVVREMKDDDERTRR